MRETNEHSCRLASLMDALGAKIKNKKSLAKPLDKHQIVCYNKYIKRKKERGK